MYYSFIVGDPAISDAVQRLAYKNGFKWYDRSKDETY